jgi:hypothetical protein
MFGFSPTGSAWQMPSPHRPLLAPVQSAAQVVQLSVASQTPLPQQSGVRSKRHWLLTHEGVRQASVVVHCETVVQQLGMAVAVHWFDTHESVVHWLPSLQSDVARQQLVPGRHALHVVPAKSAVHVQVNDCPSGELVHVPPFWHGLLSHGPQVAGTMSLRCSTLSW